MRRTYLLLVLLAAIGGCGGHYSLTVPDQVAPAGGQFAVVSRLQRNDFFVLSMAVPGANMRYSVVGESALRSSFTDELGYSGALLPAPGAAGWGRVSVQHMDSDTEEISADAPLYVLDPRREVFAVDVDCLPGGRSSQLEPARSALAKAAARGSIIYMTRKPVGNARATHEFLMSNGYPDGPVLLWRREEFHIIFDDRFKMPRVVVESRLVSQLVELRKSFPALKNGVCDSSLAAKAFTEAGMQAVVVGGAATGASRRNDWADLAARGF